MRSHHGQYFIAKDLDCAILTKTLTYAIYVE